MRKISKTSCQPRNFQQIGQNIFSENSKIVIWQNSLYDKNYACSSVMNFTVKIKCPYLVVIFSQFPLQLPGDFYILWCYYYHTSPSITNENVKYVFSLMKK